MASNNINNPEEERIYDIISKSLESLCIEKPNEPIYFLSSKMLEQIGETIESMNLKPYNRINNKEKLMNNTLDRITLRSFNSTYKIIKLIRREKDGSLFLCQLRSDKTYEYIVKIMKKNTKLFLSETEKEKLLQLDHRNLLKIKDIIDEKTSLFFIYEYCEYGSLLNFLSTKRITSHSTIIDIIRQIFYGLKYLHENGLIHRKLSIENIMVYNFENNSCANLDNENENKENSINEQSQLIHIKISDYGCGLYIENEIPGDDLLNIIFSAPETFKGNYSQKSDLWSLGIISYFLLGGKFPYLDMDLDMISSSNNNKEEISKLKKADLINKIINIDISYLSLHTKEEKQFLRKILLKNPQERSNLDYLLNDNLINEDKELSSYEKVKFAEIFESLSNFSVGKNLRYILLNYIYSNKLFNEKNFELSKIFEEFDLNHDGILDKDETLNVIKTYFPGTNEEQTQKFENILMNIDINKDNKISYSEFIILNSLFHKENNRLILKDVFDFFDGNHNGYIEIKDLSLLLKQEKIDNDRLQEMIGDFDSNSDGKINFEEFCHILDKY